MFYYCYLILLVCCIDVSMLRWAVVVINIRGVCYDFAVVCIGAIWVYMSVKQWSFGRGGLVVVK